MPPKRRVNGPPRGRDMSPTSSRAPSGWRACQARADRRGSARRACSCPSAATTRSAIAYRAESQVRKPVPCAASWRPQARRPWLYVPSARDAHAWRQRRGAVVTRASARGSQPARPSSATRRQSPVGRAPSGRHAQPLAAVGERERRRRWGARRRGRITRSLVGATHAAPAGTGVQSASATASATELCASPHRSEHPSGDRLRLDRSQAAPLPSARL